MSVSSVCAVAVLSPRWRTPFVVEDVLVRRRFGHRRALDPQELVVQTVAEHAESLLRVARRHSSCQADAEDATSAR